jgi:hypothetical protein
MQAKEQQMRLLLLLLKWHRSCQRGRHCVLQPIRLLLMLQLLLLLLSLQ